MARRHQTHRSETGLMRYAANVPVRLRVARTCYDHLAGRVAVEVCKALVKANALVLDGAEYRLTQSGTEWLKDSGIEIDAGRSKRAFARCCLDWSEQEPHLGGALGAAILRRLVEARLAVRVTGREMSVSSLDEVLENLRVSTRTAAKA